MTIHQSRSCEHKRALLLLLLRLLLLGIQETTQLIITRFPVLVIVLRRRKIQIQIQRQNTPRPLPRLMMEIMILRFGLHDHQRSRRDRRHVDVVVVVARAERESRGGRRGSGSVASHVAAERLPRRELGPADRALVDLVARRLARRSVHLVVIIITITMIVVVSRGAEVEREGHDVGLEMVTVVIVVFVGEEGVVAGLLVVGES